MPKRNTPVRLFSIINASVQWSGCGKTANPRAFRNHSVHSGLPVIAKPKARPADTEAIPDRQRAGEFLRRLPRDDDALDARGLAGGVALQVTDISRTDVEVDDGGFLAQVDDRLSGLPLHRNLPSHRRPWDPLKGVPPYSLSIKITWRSGQPVHPAPCPVPGNAATIRQMYKADEGPNIHGVRCET